MNLRQKILLMFSLTVILAVAAVAWTVSVRMRSLFEGLDRDRTAALVNQFVHQYQRRGDEVARRVDRITSDERVARMPTTSTTAAMPPSMSGKQPRWRRNMGLIIWNWCSRMEALSPRRSGRPILATRSLRSRMSASRSSSKEEASVRIPRRPASLWCGAVPGAGVRTGYCRGRATGQRVSLESVRARRQHAVSLSQFNPGLRRRPICWLPAAASPAAARYRDVIDQRACDWIAIERPRIRGRTAKA